jgi:hypothetical protein
LRTAYRASRGRGTDDRRWDGQQRRKRGGRLRRYHGQQPGAADALVQRRLVLIDREAGKDGVGQADPPDDRRDPQRQRDALIAGLHHALAAEHAGGGDGREEAGLAQLIDHVGEESARVAREAQHRRQPQHRLDDAVQLEQHAKDSGQREQVCGD